MLIGYARVSTDDQNLHLQIDALGAAGCEKIYTDHISGVKAARPGLSLAFEVARTDDVLVIWRLDRLGRSLKDLIEKMDTLEKRGIGLSSLQEAISTTNSSGRLIFHLFGTLAEFERNLMRERTTAGLDPSGNLYPLLSMGFDRHMLPRVFIIFHRLCWILADYY